LTPAVFVHMFFQESSQMGRKKIGTSSDPSKFNDRQFFYHFTDFFTNFSMLETVPIFYGYGCHFLH